MIYPIIFILILILILKYVAFGTQRDMLRWHYTNTTVQ